MVSGVYLTLRMECTRRLRVFENNTRLFESRSDVEGKLRKSPASKCIGSPCVISVTI